MSQQIEAELRTDPALHSKGASIPSEVRPPVILMELVERFRVCWEILPDVSLLGNEECLVGFALELHGTHEPSADHPAKSCIHCHNVFAALHIIADWILPRERRASMVGAEVSSPSSRHSPMREKPFGVTFAIRVAHRGTYVKLSHDCETQWLEEMEGRLRELGVSEVRTQPTKGRVGQWRLT